MDQISNGRLEIGIGAGWMDEEYKACGYEFPSMGTRLKQFEEGVQILKLMFTEKRATFKGRHYTIQDAINSPKPVQQPHPPITIGGSGEKVMLKLVARFANRWNCPAGYESFEHKFNVLKQHCKDVGRDVNTIDVSEQLLVCIGQNDAEVEQKWKMAQGMKPFSTTGIKGTPKQLIEQLKKRVAMGITTFTIFFSDFAPQLLITHPAEVKVAHAPLVALFTELLTQAQAAGRLRPSVNPRRTAALTMQTVMFTAQSSGVPDDETAHPITADEVWDFCALGFAKA